MNDTGFGRGEHSPLTGENARGSAALMVDFDNVTLGIRTDLQKQLKLIMGSDVIRGKISVRRAYADWRRYPQYIVPLSEASFDLIFAPAFGASKKNATDIRLAIDAVELVFARPEIGTFILLSGDSDFSSLVLKLKEYGKYVIGVGIRESASDLLIQNCDEYYSYTELTGFKREGQEEDSRRDPWGLVVDAVVQMKERGDVMRSDRLKQVMQEQDPRFTEKNVGFNKFSRFVVECAKRGLLKVAKLENGQYEVDFGKNANVQPEMEARLAETESTSETGTTGKGKPTALSLSEAFDSLKTVLQAGGADKKTFASEDLRELLEKQFGQNPVFHGARFNRLLRQAHDAELIELTRDEGRGYLLRLAERFRAEVKGVAGKAKDGQAAVTSPAPARKKKKSTRKKIADTETGSRSTPGQVDVSPIDAPANAKKSSGGKPAVRKKKKTVSASRRKHPPAASPDENEAPDQLGDDGLFRRVSAVVNKAIRGDRPADEA